MAGTHGHPDAGPSDGCTAGKGAIAGDAPKRVEEDENAEDGGGRDGAEKESGEAVENSDFDEVTHGGGKKISVRAPPGSKTMMRPLGSVADPTTLLMANLPLISCPSGTAT